ncbi:hypothetical protein [Psychroserpens sp. NJDZ02]|uniref:hypothetical protein n=1 Tax=Psychroserpens sp. NJDZ02 TaxID=2570561 RepID=UPI0010A768E5|nr:hypothetical protein [Psychroserpens sp. NJDZ02]QCE41945.1 hypothetical protein E9099_11140 [Psychroserpens sp. NJDZ02]
MKQFMIFLICLTYYNTVYSQDILYNLSFEANQGNYNNSYGEYYYHIKKEENRYRLTTKKKEYIFPEAFDTIVKNAHFIKTVKQNVINIYRTQNLEKIEIPNLKQVYFIRNGLEVLTNQGAQYFDNSITKINNFPKLNIFTCGTVYSEQYTLKHNEKSQKHSIEISEGYFGGMDIETILNFNNLPDNVKSLSFLNDKKYTSESVNNKYYTHPNLIKIIKDGKSGIYSYKLDDAKFPKKEKRKVKEKYAYDIDVTTGDTIFMVVPEIIEIEPISFAKKGEIKLNQILAIEYDYIQQSEINGLIYLYKNKQIGIYPNHIITNFDKFKEKTTSFYEITKNEKQGWIDIRTFQEYYF